MSSFIYFLKHEIFTGKTFEQFVSIDTGMLVFKDSLNFLNDSLDSLVR